VTIKQKKLVKFILWICIFAGWWKNYFHIRYLSYYRLLWIIYNKYFHSIPIRTTHTFGKMSYLGGNSGEQHMEAFK